jgi:hypothetical protein
MKIRARLIAMFISGGRSDSLEGEVVGFCFRLAGGNSTEHTSTHLEARLDTGYLETLIGT